VGAALFVAALYWYVYLKGPVCKAIPEKGAKK
jgi:hypothetical protein